MKTTFTYDHYADYAELTTRLVYFSEHYPNYTRLTSLGKTPEGRDLWAMEVTDLRCGDFDEKPAQHIDGNTHAGEVTGSMAALHQLDVLLTGCEEPRIARLLQAYTFTFIPRISPDGAEVYLKTPDTLRSVNRPSGKAQSGVVRQDLDQDGVIRWMRIPDETGAWTADAEEPRLLRRRRPDETDGVFYTVMPEGLLQGENEGLLKAAPARWGLDFNRNYPCWWRPEQPGAGDYPLDNPETRAVAEFLIAHPNVGVMVTHHTSGGMILNPPGPFSEAEQDPLDRSIYHAIGALATEEMGYPLLNLYDGFHCTESDYAAGAGDDWAYLNRGIFAVTAELWDLQSRAGISVEEKLEPELSNAERLRQQKLTLAWIDAYCPQAWKPWTPLEHPQLGQVEIGGLDYKFTIQNCPPAYLREECEKATQFALRQVCLLPRLAIMRFQAQPLGHDFVKVTAEIVNRGYLPTWISRQRQAMKLTEPIQIELTGAEILQGQTQGEIEALEGYGQDQTELSFSGVYGQTAALRRKLEWVVRAPAGTRVQLNVRCAQAGQASASCVID